MADLFLSHLEWSGAAKGPTRDAATFSRDLDVTIDGTTVPMSSAAGFRGDPLRVNPEQLYVASLSACHALTFLFLAARSRIAVTGYTDDAVGMLAMVDGKLRMANVTLRPRIVLEAGVDIEKARVLVEKAHRDCFITNSVTAQVDVEPQFVADAVPMAS